MEDKTFIFTSELNKRMLEIRLEYDWLFRKKKQPWREFHKILHNNGFPKEMTINQLRKRWSYMYDTYKIAKRNKQRHWKYYKLFEKIYGKTQALDKYELWSDEWRLKFITCIIEAKKELKKADVQSIWRTVETAMRCQDLPLECCIQDFKGLWHHIKMTFSRKHRLQQKRRGAAADWPLYDSMLEYYQQLEPAELQLLAADGRAVRQRKSSLNYCKRDAKRELDDEFQWSKDITETFIQLRLQNDWLFRERKWAWNDLLAIMVNNYGFPKTLTGREISRKWAATYSEYQKSKATNNKSWVYYTLFELYLGEGKFSLNPAVDWKEEWLSCLISARIENEHNFKYDYKDEIGGWREVEKRLRISGLPLDHSLLDIQEIWVHLEKTYKWKKKFATKGILTEQWPYFDAMARYEAIKVRTPIIKKQKREPDLYETGAVDDDCEDDMILMDLKQKWEQVKPKIEFVEANQCRSCANDEGCVNIFDHVDQDGVDLANKLRVVGGVEIAMNDNLPSQICLHCLRELESAYKFRQLCQNIDKTYRSKSCNIKTEGATAEDNVLRLQNDGNHKEERLDLDEFDHNYDTDYQEDTEAKVLVKKEAPKIIRKRKKIRKERYDYAKICEVCGKYTRNLMSHIDMHSNTKAYSCDVCDKKFKFKSGLIIHKAVHDPTPRKTCEVCGKTFHILAQYRRHFVYHANERKYECETCGKRFNTMDILRVHNRTHTDERPFACSDCGKTFRTAGCVSRHKRIVHKTKQIQTETVVQ